MSRAQVGEWRAAVIDDYGTWARMERRVYLMRDRGDRESERPAIEAELAMLSDRIVDVLMGLQ